MIKSNQEFKKLILDNKHYLKGKKVKIGKKTFIFDGAGDVNLLFRYPVSGLSTKNVSLCKAWVRYENLNPVIKHWLIKELSKLENEGKILL